ncbi:MAG: hypothetical protein Q6J44_01355 [Gloeomargarita sp. DG02_4_bins_56]
MAPYTNTADQFAEEMAEIMLESLRDYLLDPDVSERYALDENQAGAFIDQMEQELTEQLRQLYVDMQEE